MTAVKRYCTALLMSSVVACTGGADNPEHELTVVMEGEVRITANRGGPRFSGELFFYEEELVLRQDEEEPESLLGSPRQFFTDGHGMYFVEDGRNCRIAVFDASGRYKRSIGRRGNGPGEFSQFGWSLRGYSDGVLTTYDYIQRRTTRFGTDGSILDIIPAPNAVRGSSDVTYLPDEQFYVVALVHHTEAENIASVGVRFLTISTDGDTLGSAATPTTPTQYLTIIPWVDPLNQRMWMSMPFTSWPSAHYVPGRGVMMTTGGEPTLWWYRLDGTLMEKTTLDLPPRPVTQQERNRELQELDALIERSEGRARDAAVIRRRAIQFPEEKACWYSVLVDDRGFIWLEIPESNEEKEVAGGGVPFRLLSPEGEYLGNTRAPVTGRVMSGRLLGFRRDPETDERTPVVWQLIPQYRQMGYR